MFGTDPTGYEPEEEIIRIVIRCGAGQKCDDPDVGKTDGDHSSRNRDGNGESNGAQESPSVPTEPEIVEIGSQKRTNTNSPSSGSAVYSGMGALAHFGGGGSSSLANNTSNTLDSVQTGLDIFGMIPVIGELADFANAGLSFARGDYAGAALSIAAMVPFVGNAATGLKYIRKASSAKYGPNGQPVRIAGDWSVNDMKAALLGHPPKGLGKPDLHHADQMPGSGIHEVLPVFHRGNKSLHPNKFNQGVTPEMRDADRKLHWWYRAREQGADDVLPNWIYD